MSRDTSTETPQDGAAARGAFHVPYSRADKLAADAAEAAQVRALTQHPDVIALRVEKVRTQVDALVWAGIVLGLGFTMVNVQHFAAAGAAAWSLPWLAAWLLDPMVSLVLVAVLRAEQVTARYQVPAAPWARRAKWFAFTATYVMNTWTSWAALDPAGIVLHSVPPIGVLCAAEAAPWLRDRLTEAVHAVAHETHHAERGGDGPTGCAVEPAEPGPQLRPGPAEGYCSVTHTGAPENSGAETLANTASTPAETGPTPAREHAEAPAHERAVVEATNTPATTEHTPANGGADDSEPVPTTARPSSTAPAANTAEAAAGAGRKLLADYVAEAREAHTPGVDVTPAWVRQVTDCARSTSAKVATQLRDELTADTDTPDAAYAREAA